jgi:hypothetical protein
LEKDPKRHFYDRSNPAHLINKPNRMNQTPLYVACRNGNLAVVTFLVREGADPHIMSSIDNDEEETPLEVSARWNHKVIVQFLLEKVSWTEAEVKKAIKIEDINLEILAMLKRYSQKRFNCFFNFFLCA